MTQNELIVNRPTAAIGEEIGYELGTELITKYHQANPSDTSNYIVGRNIIEKILAQPGCDGIHFYNAINEAGNKTLVYVGVDKNGNNIFEYTVVNAAGTITSEDGIVGDRSDADEGSFWKWLFGF
jgi:hypothetical protein